MIDVNNVTRDVSMGYDSASVYHERPDNETFGGIQGQYSNDNTASNEYQLAPGGMVDTVPALLQDNPTTADTPTSWSRRNWTIVAQTIISVTFSLVDIHPVAEADPSFPGQTVTYVTHTLTPKRYHVRIVSLSTTDYTPLMPISRTYWNLDALADPATPTVLNHTLRLPYSGLRVQVDNSTRVATGLIEENSLYSIYDFWHASKPLGRNLTSPRARSTCGVNCTGYDTTFLINRDAAITHSGSDSPYTYDWTTTPVAQLESKFSGLRMYLYTDQAALHVETCNNFNGSVPLKADQGLLGGVRDATVQQHGCVASHQRIGQRAYSIQVGRGKVNRSLGHRTAVRLAGHL